MLWIALGAMFAIAAFVTLLVVALGRGSRIDLGAVSSRWIAEHRVDAT